MKVLVRRRNTENKRPDPELIDRVARARELMVAVKLMEDTEEREASILRKTAYVDKGGKRYVYPRIFIYIPQEFVRELGLDKASKVKIILDKKNKLLIVYPVHEESEQ